MARTLRFATMLCLMLVVLFSALTACREPAAVTDTEPPPPEVSPSSAPAELPATPEARPVDFTWKPVVYSDIYRKVYGEETEAAYLRFAEALASRTERVPCADETQCFLLGSLARTLFPPYTALVSSIAYADGEIVLSYVYDEAGHRQQLEAFAAQITALIQDAVMEGDSPAVTAIALYHSYSQKITYDHEAAKGEEIVDVTPYRGLMDLQGICQTFGPGYAFLCLQMGIDAVPAGGLNREATESHEWTLLRLDGEYYYADPTFENGMDPSGLRYFGMTGAQRELEGDYPADDYNIGDTNLLWGRDISVTSERFAPLWEAARVVKLFRGPEGVFADCRRADGSAFSFPIK